VAKDRPARARKRRPAWRDGDSNPETLTPSLQSEPHAVAASERARVVIEGVSPEIDSGRFPIKRIVGDAVVVEADIFADGHEVLCCELLHRRSHDRDWSAARMEDLGRDRWRGSFEVTGSGRWTYTLRGWIDHFATWRRDLVRRLEAGQDVEVDLRIGAALLRSAAGRADVLAHARELDESDRAARDAAVANPAEAEAGRGVLGPSTRAQAHARRLQGWAADLDGDLPTSKKTELARSEVLSEIVSRYPDPHAIQIYERELQVVVDRAKARYSTWYELFPRSCAAEPGGHGTLRDVEARLPEIARMGFDVLYIPPIHPIGRSHRKGRNNTPSRSDDDPGSPWAIGSAEGGHMSVHPQLGTLNDFGRLVERAREVGVEIALDLAFQCSPDHPWVQEHPEWFRRRPDGSIQCAENPPKKYEDILPFDFESAGWRELWQALRDVVEFWAARGVRIFRVDNPHTKPFRFWEWLIEVVKERYPDTLFFSEAFTRRRVMYRLAKLGFTQSYTYFTWRNTKQELQEYMLELTRTPVREYFRPNFWPNTPDILSECLQYGGRPAFMGRLVLAAMLSSSYGIYGPAYELCENRAREAGSEEYLNSEKYEIRYWDLERAGNLQEFVTRLNTIRKRHPALQSNDGLRLHSVDNEQILCFSKTTPDRSDLVLVLVNMDFHHARSGWVDLPPEELGIDPEQPYQLHDLLSDARYLWHGRRNFVQIDPHACPAHVFHILRRVRRENDFEYYF
jgi:starch synthase (maltosyl-transferring)